LVKTVAFPVLSLFKMLSEAVRSKYFAIKKEKPLYNLTITFPLARLCTAETERLSAKWTHFFEDFHLKGLGHEMD
jgi:hypothetical protein